MTRISRCLVVILMICALGFLGCSKPADSKSDAPKKETTTRHLDERTRKRLEAKVRESPSQRGLVQRTYDTPAAALKAYLLALHSQDEKELAQVAGEGVWKQFQEFVEKDDGYFNVKPWEYALQRMHIDYWSTKHSTRYPIEFPAADQAIALATTKYQRDGRSINEFVEIEFQQSDGRWKITDRRVGDPNELANGRLRKPLNPHPDLVAAKALEELGAGGLNFYGTGVEIDGDLSDDGININPGILEAAKKATLVSDLEIHSRSFTDAAFAELFPVLTNITSLEIGGGDIGQPTMDKIGQLTHLRELMLSSYDGFKNVKSLPFGKLEKLYRVELRGFPNLDPGGFDTWSDLTGIDRITLRNLGGITGQSLSNLSNSKELRQLELAGVEGITDEGFEYLGRLFWIEEYTLANLRNFNGAGLEHLKDAERINLKVHDMTLIGDELASLSKINVTGLEFHNVTFTGSGLREFGKIETIYSLEFHECQFDPTSVTELSKMKFEGTRNYIWFEASLNTKDVPFLSAIKHQVGISFRDAATDNTLKQLESVDNLTYLQLREKDKVSEEAIENLKTALPELKVQKFDF